MRLATEPKPGSRVPANVANSIADQLACPAPRPYIEVSAGPGSKSTRLKLPVTLARAATPS